MSTITFTYRNHHGKESVRQVKPIGVMFVRNPGFGYQAGWFLHGFCLDKNAVRSFALSHIILPDDCKTYILEWPTPDESAFDESH